MMTEIEAPAEIYLDLFDADKVNQILDEWGVCVVNRQFSPEQTDQWREAIINWLVGINPQLAKKWVDYNAPHGPRSGMMQNIVSHCPTIWEIREAFYPLFKEIWGEESLLTSIDGASIHPPKPDRSADWPHIDQTVENVRCIQGEVVLTDTTASFRCTPQSHLHHSALLEKHGKKGDPSNWLKFSPKDIKEMEKDFKYWQVPIHAPAGSVIFWRSNTIHSAKRNDKGDDSWRCVVYVCQRPEWQFTDPEKATLRKAALEGRTTNHWGTKIFPKRPGHWMQPRRAEQIEKLAEDPSSLVIEYSDLLKKLTAQEAWVA